MTIYTTEKKTKKNEQNLSTILGVFRDKLLGAWPT